MKTTDACEHRSTSTTLGTFVLVHCKEGCGHVDFESDPHIEKRQNGDPVLVVGEWHNGAVVIQQRTGEEATVHPMAGHWDG